MAQDLAALTNTWMLNPTMFDPSQASNQFSNYNGAALPWPPTYSTAAGGPVNAATGKPIQSFQNWQAANPGGMSLNSTPAQPPQTQQPDMLAMRNAALTGQPGAAQAYGANFAPPGSQPGIQAMYGRNFAAFTPQGNATPAAQQQGGQQTSAPPNNWQAALSALANPGNPVTQGATVPMVSGSQPAGGVNNAFLQQAGAGQGMNQNFLSALRAIQARPQG
jgi:hypothetical protein